MWFKHRAWIPVAWLLSLGNLAGLWVAARALPAEPWHATGHGVLAVLFALAARRLTARQRVDAQTDQLQQAIDANDQLQQSMDGMQIRLQELEERLDFAERLLATHQDRNRIERE